MNRVIKFRAFDTHRNKMQAIGFHIIGEHTVFNVLDDYRIEDLNNIVIMQFTGLKDCTKWEELTKNEREKWTKAGNMLSEWNGRDIYEDDVIERHLDKSITTSIVIYCERHSALVRQRISEYKNGINDGNYDFLDKKTISSNIGFKVIGNIWENPELLEKS